MADPDTFQIVEPVADDAARPTLGRSDAIGIGLSILCAIHCAATPVLIALLPALGGSTAGGSTLGGSTLGIAALEQPWVHQALFIGCLLLAGNAVMRGFRVHGRRAVPGLATVGLGLLAASAFVWPAPCCADGVCGAELMAAGIETATEAGGTDASNTHGHCSHGHCSHHHGGGPSQEPKSSDGVGAEIAVATTDADQMAAASLVPPAVGDLWLRLMTPLGGLLLIVAHGLNIRWTRRCSCGCCPA